MAAHRCLVDMPPGSTVPAVTILADMDSISPRTSIQIDRPQGADGEPLRVLAFDTQSTCAQLFSKQLSAHLKIGTIHHPYVLAATLGPERIHRKIGNDQTKRLWQGRADGASARVKATTFEVATNDLLRNADKLEQKDKTVFITEYPPFVIKHEFIEAALKGQETIVSRLTNPTVIPDDLLKLLTPIIFINHPALTIPNWLRLARNEYGSCGIDEDDFAIWTSLRWSRILFDYLRSTQHLKRQDSVHSNHSTERWEPGYVATRPYVIDAADVANNTHAMVAATCRLLGIDYKEVSTSWLKYFERAASTALKKTLPSITNAFSEHLLSSQASAINLDAETVEWRKEFGPEVADTLRKRVDEEMVHYRYLQNFKVRVLPSLTTSALMQNITGMPVRRSSAVTPNNAEIEGLGVGHPLRIIKTAINEPQKRRKSDYR